MNHTIPINKTKGQNNKKVNYIPNKNFSLKCDIHKIILKTEINRIFIFPDLQIKVTTLT